MPLPSRKVSFSTSLEDISELRSYSREERDRFLENLLADIQALRQFFATAGPEDLTHDIVCKSIRIEAFIDQDLRRLSTDEKRAHSDLVLNGARISSNRKRSRSNARKAQLGL